MNDNLRGRKSKLNLFDRGWNCEVCAVFVGASWEDGYPVSRYWRPQKNPQVVEAFCSADCALIDYEDNKNA